MRNFEKEYEINNMSDAYREKLPKSQRAWAAISGAVDLSRNAASGQIFG